LHKLKAKGLVEKAGHGIYVKKGDVATVKKLRNPLQKKVLNVIPSSSTIKIKDIIEKINDYHKHSIYNELLALIKKGEVERVSRGVYKMKKGATIPSKEAVIGAKRKDDKYYKYPQAPSIKWKTNIA
jgi:predicted transcriptional regulator of viral defense system